MLTLSKLPSNTLLFQEKFCCAVGTQKLNLNNSND